MQCTLTDGTVWMEDTKSRHPGQSEKKRCDAENWAKK